MQRPAGASASTIFCGWNIKADQVKSCVHWGTVAIGFLITLVTFWPGYMSPDSVSQLEQGRAGVYGDWHPPLMSWLWGRLDAIFPGPGMMLLLQNTLFWAGLGLLARRWVRAPWSGLFVLGVGLFPPIFGLLSTIWKDVQIVGALTMAFALLVVSEHTRSYRALIASVVLLGYAIACRHNGIFAAAPLAFWAVVLALRHRSQTLVRPVPSGAVCAGFALVLLGGLFLGVQVITELLTRPVKEYPVQQILIHDLWAVSVDQSQNFLPDYARHRPASSSVENLRQSFSALSIGLGPAEWGPSVLAKTTDRGELRELMDAWLRVIPAHPSSYLAHRWQIAKMLFGISGVSYPFHDGGPAFVPFPWNRKVMSLLESCRNSFVYRGWIYILVSIVALALARRRGRASVVVLSASALLYAIPYFFVAPVTDFRFLSWTVVATCLALLGVLVPQNEDWQGKTR